MDRIRISGTAAERHDPDLGGENATLPLMIASLLTDET